jgi:adenine/guanine phosphoribosyltransferase-like PRPP-binding protein
MLGEGCEHTRVVLNHKNRNQIVMNTIKGLRDYDYDSIVCCGTSGIIVAPQVCEILNKEIVIVRKDHEKRYSPFVIEGILGNRFVFLDDLVCSGGTLRHVIKNIKEEHPYAKCAGVYCYMKDKCGYRNAPECFYKDFGLDYLNKKG